MGYDQVIEARHGGEALDYLRSAEVDLLLTDWNMPVLTGLDLIKKLRQDASFDRPPRTHVHLPRRETGRD